MEIADLGDVRLHVQIDGPADGHPVVFANSLGTDLRLWDPIMPYLPDTLRVLRYDKRGHGLSDCPAQPYSMGQLVSDAERLMDRYGFKNAVFVGLSIGGLIAQGLAAKRMDLIRAMILSNTGAKIGTRDMWADRINIVNTQGIDAMGDAVMERWFSKDFLDAPELALWRNMLVRQEPDGYAGCSAAIAGTDFYASTANLRLPALGIAGAEDGATPPDLVRETIDLIPGSSFALIRRAGHLPCVEKPEEYAGLVVKFLEQVGHLGSAD